MSHTRATSTTRTADLTDHGQNRLILEAHEVSNSRISTTVLTHPRPGSFHSPSPSTVSISNHLSTSRGSVRYSPPPSPSSSSSSSSLDGSLSSYTSGSVSGCSSNSKSGDEELSELRFIEPPQGYERTGVSIMTILQSLQSVTLVQELLRLAHDAAYALSQAADWQEIRTNAKAWSILGKTLSRQFENIAQLQKSGKARKKRNYIKDQAAKPTVREACSEYAESLKAILAAWILAVDPFIVSNSSLEDHTEALPNYPTTARTLNRYRLKTFIKQYQDIEIDEEKLQDYARIAESALRSLLKRQARIWSQNRRAKAKNQDQRHDWDLSAGTHLESYIAHLILEKEPVTLIPCTDLKIGDWTRINPSSQHHEVLAYTSQSRQCISWFIRSSGLSFKIEVPFDILKSAYLMDVKAPDLITLVLELNSKPLFFVQQPDVRMRPGETISDVRNRLGIENHLPLPNVGADPGEWLASNDWTEDQQASRVLRHELTGLRTSIIPSLQVFPQELGLL